MAEQGPPQPLMSAPFPAPPPFFKSFTVENIAKIEELQNAHDETARSSSSASHPIVFSLPPELRASSLTHLIPPPPPPDGAHRLFGQPRTINAALPPLPPGIPSLYTSPPTPGILLNLTRSIMLNFLEFVHILATNPDDFGPKWDDLAALFRNTERALNEYRPFLAREEMIRLLEEEVKRGQDELEGVKAMKRRVDDVLGGIRDGAVKAEREDDALKQRESRAGIGGASSRTKEMMGLKGDWSEERAMWEVLHGI